MGGQNAIKGYLFQSLIAVLNSFDKMWDHICVEPTTDLDKIDIIWSGDDFIEVCQVKSSINNFSKGDILKWISFMQSDNPNADKYMICLIGSSDNVTKQFFNAIKLTTIEDFPSQYPALHNIKEKIVVIFEPNNIATLEGALVAGVDKFFYSHDILADHPTKSLIANGMVNQIIRLSTSGTKMSRYDFEKHLLDWVRFNYVSQIKSKTSAAFELAFYKERQIEFTNSICKTHLANLEDLEIYSKKISSLRQKFQTISRYNFPVKSFEEPANSGFQFRRSFAMDELNGYTDRQVLVDNWNIAHMTKLMLKLMGIEPEREFFNFGELKESQPRNMGFMFHSKKSWKGSEDELKKKKLYDEFYWELIELEDLITFWNKVNKLSILPLVLSNTGTQFEEDIKVHLIFPKSVKIYSAKNFPAPERSQILSDITDDSNFFFNLIRHRKSRHVEDYSNQFVFPQFFSLRSLMGDAKIENLRKFRRLLDYYFEFEFFDEEEHKVFEYNFKRLNSNAKVAFPAFLFISSDHDFDIEYRITCKNNVENITGKLHYLTKNNVALSFNGE